MRSDIRNLPCAIIGPPESVMTLSAGDRLGRYEILGPLGVGGMGEVCSAHDEESNCSMAVEVLLLDSAPAIRTGGPDLIERER